MSKLDSLLPLPHSALAGLPFTVPGMRVILAQPTTMVCWGDGTVDGTVMHIIDPAGGRQYQEDFRTFFTKYEGAFGQVSGDYFQIRHFR